MRSRLTSLLGLDLDGSRLEGVALRRTNGSFQITSSFSVSLSLDPLTNDPELVGREIRNHLDAAEARERNCIVGLPLKWALMTHVELPELPEADVESFLALEAERGFPCDIQTLLVADFRCRAGSGKQHALLAGIPRSHLERMERVLRAAKLKPVSFTLGITALQPASPGNNAGVLALGIGESQVALEVIAGGGVAALRALEGALEIEGSRRVLRADVIAREVRITLGQMPTELREAVRSIRVFGPRDLAQQLADELELRLDATGLKAEAVTRYIPEEFGAQLPPQTAVSPALSLAARRLAGQEARFEFLPPKVTAWQQMSARYSSGKLRAALSIAGAAAVLAGGLFLYQQFRLWNLESQWGKIRDKVVQLQETEGKIRQFRDWYDESARGMTILRGLTQAFPEDGAVTAKTVEIRELKTVVCTGTARDRQSLLQTVQKLRETPQIREVNLGPTRGQAPLQFSLNFIWNEGSRSAN
jgi:hypothetical protein